MKSRFNLPGHKPEWPFSDAVKVGNTVYFSGRIGFTPGTMTVPDDPAEEVRYLMDGLKDVLELVGMIMDDLVMVQIHTPDVSLFDTFNRVYTKYFDEELPARAFLGSGPLLMGARFELIAIAARG